MESTPFIGVLAELTATSCVSLCLSNRRPIFGGTT